VAKSSLISNPLISICIPAYNCGKYILETLNCLCAQTYSPIEIIVVNDGSTDDTEAVIKQVTDERIRLIFISNGGAAKARNVAFNNAKGEYIVFFDADDFVKPDFIMSQADKIQGRKDAVVLALWGRFYNDDLQTFKLNDTPVDEMTFEEWIKYYWCRCNPMTNPGRALIPVTLVKEAGLWNEELSLNDDLEFFTRVFLKTKKLLFNHDAIFYYRSGISGLSGEKSDKAYKSLYNSILFSVNNVLSAYDYDQSLLKSCANMWQSFIYEVYPFQKKYLQLANAEIKNLMRPDYRFMASGYTKYLVKIIGWKLTKKIKLALK